MGELALVLKAFTVIGSVWQSITGIIAARQAGKISEEQAGERIDQIAAAACSATWQDVTPDEP